MAKLLNTLERILLVAALTATFVMVVLTTADALGRYILNWPIIGAYEITERYLMALGVFFAVCYAYREGSNIRVTLVVRRLSPRAQLRLAYFVQILSLFYGAALFITAVIFMVRNAHDQLIVSKFTIPMLPAYLVVPVGLFFMSLRMFLDLWQIREGKSGLFKEGADEL